MYIFLKEFCNNAPVHRLFRDWFEKKDLFERRSAISSKRMQATLLIPSPNCNMKISTSECRKIRANTPTTSTR
jgi:hypothetical protein